MGKRNKQPKPATAKAPPPCGPYALAAATGEDLQTVADMRRRRGFYTPLAEMIHVLKKLKRKPVYKRAGPAQKKIALPEGCKKAIAFLQWGKQHLHWLYLEQAPEGLKVHCSVKGDYIQGPRSRYAKSHIRSYLVLG